MRVIRFHDLRHSCASLLLANDVPMKQIQDWLGHSTIVTTEMYAHLLFKSKIKAADAMLQGLGMPLMDGNTPQLIGQAVQSDESPQGQN
jgi:integrase